LVYANANRLNVAAGERSPLGVGLANFDGIVIAGSPFSIGQLVERECLAAARRQANVSRGVITGVGFIGAGALAGVEPATAVF